MESISYIKSYQVEGKYEPNAYCTKCGFGCSCGIGKILTVVTGDCKICHQFPCKHIDTSNKEWKVKNNP